MCTRKSPTYLYVPMMFLLNLMLLVNVMFLLNVMIPVNLMKLPVNAMKLPVNVMKLRVNVMKLPLNILLLRNMLLPQNVNGLEPTFCCFLSKPCNANNKLLAKVAMRNYRRS